MRISRIFLVTLTVTLLAMSVAWGAVAVNWMSNFPMKMGAAGNMGMWMPVPGASGYKAMRQLDSGPFEKIYEGPMNNFTDTTAPTDKDVGYKVIAIVGGADAGESPVVTLKAEKVIQPPVNINGRLDAESQSHIMRWNAADGASFYNVYRSDKKGDNGLLLGSVQEARYTDTGIKDGTTYWYYITSVSATSRESMRGEAYEAVVKFPKKVTVKKFSFMPVLIQLVAQTRGEEWAEFKNPTDILLNDGKVYVACEDGVQVTDLEGNFLSRLPIFQEKIANGQWSRPATMSLMPNGNLLFAFYTHNIVREVDPEGTKVVREYVLPGITGNPNKPHPEGAIVAGNELWVVDSGFGNLAVLPTAPGEKLDESNVKRIGFAKGNENYDPAKHPVMFAGPGRLRYVPEKNAVMLTESLLGKVSVVDLKTHAKVMSVSGIGGAMDQVSLMADFLPMGNDTVIVLDALNNTLKTLRLSKPDDDKNGDYLSNFVDDPKQESPQLQAPAGSLAKLSYDPKTKKIYLLSTLAGEVYIYQLP